MVVLTGPLRTTLSLLAGLIALFLLKQTLTVDWGVEAMLAMLAIPLLLISMTAMGRRVLILDNDGNCWLETGRIWRRRWRLPIDREDIELELMPTAGSVALVLHVGDVGRPLATWIGRKRA